MSPSMYQLIDRKKNGLPLRSEEIQHMIQQYVAGDLPDYQMSAMLMAIFLKGMSTAETAALTDAMLNSGHHFKFTGKQVVDKHSTGGIGDKASFILAPIAAACGVQVPMIAGRGLGFTGGTIDKVEAIPGFKTSLSLTDFEKQFHEKGLVLMGQTPEIAPADGRIYALRDVTATIDSIPLITASIMSKKLAEGANGLVFDIKYGSGAFMREKKHAKLLAQSLIQTGKRFKKNCVALLTDMSQPLGNEVGHSLELRESIATLKGQGPEDLTTLSIELAAHMVKIAGKAKTLADARKRCRAVVASGEALAKFRDLIEWQGGDVSFIDQPEKLVVAPIQTAIVAPKAGSLKSLLNDQIGLMLIELGGGRKTKLDKLDLSVGFTFHKKIGDKVKKGEPVFTVHHHPHQAEIVTGFQSRFFKEVATLTSSSVRKTKLIDQVIGA